jgi:hypothetical protein
MKKNELENRLAETSEVHEAVEKTLTTVLDDIKRAEGNTGEATRVLGEVFAFVREALDSVKNVPDTEKLKFLESNLLKLKAWSQAEGDRLKSRPQFLQERAAAFQSLLGWLDERKRGHESRLAAIDRAADPNRDKRHPEKLSVKRAAAQLNEGVEESE